MKAGDVRLHPASPLSPREEAEMLARIIAAYHDDPATSVRTIIACAGALGRLCARLGVPGEVMLRQAEAVITLRRDPEILAIRERRA